MLYLTNSAKKFFLILITLITFLCNHTNAEERNIPEIKPVPYRHLLYQPVLPDSTDIALYKKKNFWRAGAEVIGLNLGIWAYDRYVIDGYYAHISWETIKNNFKQGFKWDDDHLYENMFGHPYHGSLYFNGGRSNGYNFWQSGLFALGGSAMWEIAMENVPPSINDIIATPIGGMALGEALFRTSDLIIDDSSTGGERVGREIAAFIVDPIRGFNRIVTGQAWKKRATSGRRFGLPPISLEVALGARFLDSQNSNVQMCRGGLGMEIDFEYGYRFEPSKAPYDYFSLLAELQVVKTQPLISRMQLMGRLYSRNVTDKPKLNINLGIYQHFDYFDSDTIKPENEKFHFPAVVPYKMASPASVGAGGMLRYLASSRMCIDGYAHVNALILAGVVTDLFRKYHRNYNWGSGFSAKAGLNWALTNNRLSVRLANQFYGVYTWKGYDPDINWSEKPENVPANVPGDRTSTYFNHFETAINCKVFKQWYVSIGADFFNRWTKYHNRTVIVDGKEEKRNPTVDSRQIGFNFMITHKF